MTPIIEMLILCWVGRVSGIVSFFSSLSMVYMIISDRDRRLAKSSHRLMLGLSIFDCFQSAAYAMTTIAVPVEYDTYGNMGNSTTCAAQGFFIMLGLGVPMYNASLSILYLLNIRNGVGATTFSTKVEPFLHITSVTVPIVAASLALFQGAIVSGPTVCYISHEPEAMAWILTVTGIVSFCLCVCIYSMTSICVTVNRQQKRMRRHSYCSPKPRSSKSMIPRSTRSNSTQTKDTVVQALLYVSAFILTFIFPAIAFGYASFSLEVLAKTFYPLQGFWNFLLYIRPGVKKMRIEHPDKKLIMILHEVIFHAKDRNLRVRQRRNNRLGMIDVALSPSNKTFMPVDNALKSEADASNSCSKSHQPIFGTISDEISTDNIPSVLESDNVLQMSPLYMEDKDLQAETLELNCHLGKHSLGRQRDILEGPDGSANNMTVGDQLCSFSESRDISKDAVDDSLPLDNEDNIDSRVKRRTSLINLATINSLYELYPGLDSMEDV